MLTLNLTGPIHVGPLIVSLLGGLALFLFGMEQMTEGLKSIAGGQMKDFLARWTANRFKGVFAGAFVTAVIQSSSVTTVIVVSFISAGMLTLQQSIGVIMGANIGTTITAQIIAFKVTQYALLLVAIGFGLLFMIKRERVRQFGAVVMGLGLIFFGMEVMAEATTPLQQYPPFIDLIQRMENVALAILLSAAFTAIVQSSSATTGIIVLLAVQGLIGLETGIAMALGANLGTSVTALLAAIGQPREAVQGAIIHIFFNVFGVLLWLPFISQLAILVRSVSAPDTARQIANAHTIFNVANTFVFIWFIQPLARLAQFLTPVRPIRKPEPVRPKYLDDVLLDNPALALDRVRLELEHLGQHTLTMVERAIATFGYGSRQDLAALAKMDDNVDILHEAIISYLSQLYRENVPDPLLQQQAAAYMSAANYMESIADMIETNMVELGLTSIKEGVQISRTTREHLSLLFNQVHTTVKQSIRAIVEADVEIAEEIIRAKSDINYLAGVAEDQIAHRLIADAPKRVQTFRLEAEFIEYLKRIYYFAKRIAKIVAAVDEHPALEAALTAEMTGTV